LRLAALPTVAAVAALGLVPSTAFAQASDPGAPAAGSPPANQYIIPIQAGRRDAAPPDAKRDPAEGSLYRSDNNFGSSSLVPGDPEQGNATGDGSGGSGGAGSGGAGGGKPEAANLQQLDTGSPSSAAGFTTVPLLIALGVLIGVAGVRQQRRPPQGD